MNKLILIIALALTLTGCADYVDVSTIPACTQTYGFWVGLWHGVIAPFSWIGSLFDDSVAVYEVCNDGGWYDFGFVLGIGALGGGASSSSR